MTDILFAYGTLRPPGSPPDVFVPGWLYNLGWFPGLVLGPPDGPVSDPEVATGLVACNCIAVDDWTPYDNYEGYRPDDPANSLYIRQRHDDGWIYVYNRPVLPDRLIPSGDWFQHRRLNPWK